MPRSAALVSVVIAFRVRDEAFERTLRSAKVQSFPSVEVVLSGAEETPDPGLIAWKVLDRTSGEFVCFLQAGDELAPTYLEKCLFQMAVNGEDAAAACEEPQDTAPHLIVVRKSTLLRAGDWRSVPTPRPILARRLAEKGVAIGIVPEVLALTADTPLGHAAAMSLPLPDDRPKHFSFAGLVTEPRESCPTVLLAMEYLTMGGAEAIVSQLCRQLKEQGFRILVCTTRPIRDDQGDTTPWFLASAAGIYDLPSFLDAEHWAAFVAYLIQQHGVNLLWQVGCVFVYDLLPRLCELFPQLAVADLLFNPVGHTANYLRYRDYIDRVVVEHDGMKTWLLDHGERADRVSVIPNGVDLKAYRPGPRLDWRTRQPRLRGDDRFVAAYFGRLSEEKGADIFLAMAALLADEPAVEFLLCGVGPMEAELRGQAEDFGLTGRVAFLGFVSTSDYLPCCDAVVVCSRLDGRPNIVMESLAAGVPVVASRVGGIPGMMPPGQEELLCDPNDPASFAAAIRLLKHDAHRYGRLSEAARHHAESHFSLAERGRDYAHLFEELAQRRVSLDRHRTAEEVAHRLGYGENAQPWSHPSLWQRFWRANAPAVWLGHLRNLTLWWRLRRARQEQKIWAHFDADYYKAQFPKTTRWTMAPLLHYVLVGFREGRNPSHDFHTRYYLTVHPDVRRGGFNPLLHYAMWGVSEARSIAPRPPSKKAVRRF